MPDDANPFLKYVQQPPAQQPQPATGDNPFMKYVQPQAEGANPFLKYVQPQGSRLEYAPQQQQAPGSGWLANIAAGINEGTMDVLGAPADVANWAERKVGMNVPQDPIGGSQWLKNVESLYGGEPERIVANTPGERISRAAGQGIAQALLPAGAVQGLGRAGALGGRALQTAEAITGPANKATALIGATAGAGSELAQEKASKWQSPWKEWAGPIGGLAGGAVGAAFGVGAGAFGRKPGFMESVGKVVTPETREQGGREAAAAIREHGGSAARWEEQAGVELRELKPASDRIQQAATAADPVMADGLRYTSLSREFHDYMDGVTKTLPSDPVVANAAKQMRPMFQEVEGEMRALPDGAKYSFLENYYPIQVNKQAMGFGQGGGAGKQGTSGFTKERKVYKGSSDAVNHGVVLDTGDPIRGAFKYMSNATRFLASRRILQEAKQAGIVTITSIDHYAPPGSGLVELKNVPADEKGIAQKAFAPENWAAIWNNWVSKNPEGLAGAALQAWRRMGSLTTSVELGLSGFHAIAMAQDTVSSHIASALQLAATPGQRLRAAGRIASTPVSVWRTASLGEQAARTYARGSAETGPIREALGFKMSTPQAQRIVDLLTRGGARMATGGRQRSADLQMTNTSIRFQRRVNNIRDAMRFGFKATAVPGLARDASIVAIEKGIEALSKTMAPLFDEVIPRLKDGVMMQSMADWLRANPAATDAEALAFSRQTVDSVDNRMGEMVNDNIFWNKTFKQLLMGSFLSYSWTLGTIKELYGGALQLPALALGTKSLSLQSKDVSTKAAYAIALPIAYGLYSAVTQYLMTSIHTGKAEPPNDLLDLTYPRTGGVNPDGTPERLNAFGNIKDPLHLIQKVGREGAPLDVLMGKLNPLLQITGEFIGLGHGKGGSDWAEMPIVHGDPQLSVLENVPGQAIQFFNHMMVQDLEPIAVRQVEQKKKGSALTDFERFLGFSPAGVMVTNRERAEAGKQKDIDARWKRKMKFEARQKEQLQ